MADTTFEDGVTPILAAWLNDLNLIAYHLLGNAGTPPATRADILTNLGISGGAYLVAANNLSDLASAATARTNLGLGALATQSTAAVANGGTGQTSYTDGQLLIGNSTGNTLDKATLTAGTGISITNAGGSITIDNSAPAGSVLGCLIRRSSAQSIPNNTATAVAWNGTDIYDTSSIHDPVTNNTRMTVPAGVTKVKVLAAITFDANATGERIVTMYKNGSSFTGAGLQNCVANDGTNATSINVTSAVVQVTAGDYIEIIVQQNSGGNLNIDTGLGNWASMEIIA